MPITGGEQLADVQQDAGIRPPFRPNILGLPERSSAGLISPSGFTIVESASVWKRMKFARPVYVWCPGGKRVIRYTPARLERAGATLVTQNLYLSSTSGLIRILAPGIWYFNTPIVTAEGTRVPMRFADAALDQAVTPEDVVGEAVTGGGSSGAGPDSPMSWSDDAAVTVGSADTAIYAANTSRRGLNLFNASTGGQRVFFSTGVAASNQGFLVLDPGIGRLLDVKVPTAAIRAFASAAGATVIRSEGT